MHPYARCIRIGTRPIGGRNELQAALGGIGVDHRSANLRRLPSGSVAYELPPETACQGHASEVIIYSMREGRPRAPSHACLSNEGMSNLL